MFRFSTRGEEIEKNALDVLIQYLGDDLALLLRARHKDADCVFVIGADHTIDIDKDH